MNPCVNVVMSQIEGLIGDGWSGVKKPMLPPSSMQSLIINPVFLMNAGTESIVFDFLFLVGNQSCSRIGFLSIRSDSESSLRAHGCHGIVCFLWSKRIEGRARYGSFGFYAFKSW